MSAVHAYTDGSYRLSDQSFSYGAIILLDEYNVMLNGRIFDKPEEAKSRNVAGEIYGAVKVMDYAYKNNITELVIHHDYEGVGAWPTKKWKTNLELTRKYVIFVAKIEKKVKVSFEWVKGHSGDEFNEQADRLANAASSTPMVRKVDKDARA